MFRSLFLLFLIVPLVEIYFLIQVGEVIGAGWTVFAVVGTAILGAFLLRIQGASTMLRAQSSMMSGQLPAMEMFEGIALAASGLFLLTPGFVTDAFGLILLTPPLRRTLIGWVMRRSSASASMHGMGGGFQQHGRPSASDDSIIEGEVLPPNDDSRHLR